MTRGHLQCCPHLQDGISFIFTDVNVSVGFNGDDIDWKEKEPDPEELDDDKDLDADYMPVANTSMDSDEPLVEYIRRCRGENVIRIASFIWAKRKNIPMCRCFNGDSSVHASLDEALISLDTFTNFFTMELLQKIVSEMNQ